MATRTMEMLAGALCAAALSGGCGGGGGGGGGAAAPSAGSQPAAPTGLLATVTAADAIALTWSESATGLTGHEVERATASGGPFSRVATPPAAATGYGDTGLSAGTAYWYRVRSLASGGSSDWSNVATATPADVPPAPPAAPTGLAAAVAAQDAISLTWADNASNETGFAILRATSASGPFGLVTTTAADATGWTDRGLAAGTAYWYQVAAVNAVGASAYTDPVTATTGLPPVPAAPTGLAAVQRTSGTSATVLLTWTDAATDESGYEVQKRLDGASYGATIALPAGSSSYVDDAPQVLLTSWYRVRAVNAAGGSAWAELSFYVAPVLGLAPCFPPTAPVATATSDTTAHLAWTVSSNPYCIIHNLERAPAATGPWSRIASLTGYFDIAGGWVDANSYDDTRLAPGSTSYYRVIAQDGTTYADSVPSPVFSVTTPNALAAPTGLTGAATSGVRAVLTWTLAAGSDGTAVEYATAAAGPFTEAFTVGAAFTSAEVTGLSPGTAYWFRVRATLGAARSAPTAAFAVTTPATLVLPATADTLVYASTALQSWQARNFTADYDNVGCFFSWTTDLQAQIYLMHHCAASALAFDASAFAGRTILSARLELWVCAVPPGPMTGASHMVSALAGAWNPSTVTFNALPQLYTYGRAVAAAPSGAGKSTWDVTAIVRNWADGTWRGNGLYLEQAPIVDHRLVINGAVYDTHDQTIGYCSLEMNANDPHWGPKLHVDYQ